MPPLAQVFDSALSPRSFAALRKLLEKEPLLSVHAERRHKVWSGDPRGSRTLLCEAPMSSRTWAGKVHNLLAGLDLGIRWGRLSARVYRYPPGSFLRWHADRDGYRGAYVFYTHGSWKEGDGGELLVRGAGRILPLPNRLVVLAPGPRHRTLPARRERHSVAGFLL